MIKPIHCFAAIFCLTMTGAALAELSIPVYSTIKSGTGNPVGTITVSESNYGLLFTPNLHDLTPGIHGFHIHQNPSCDNDGMAAGGHLDPSNTNQHLGPYNDRGHLGDLPALTVDAKGQATLPILAPRLMRLSDIQNHSLMIHEGGDNYSDEPAKLGGGGTRMECGIIPITTARK
jgi:Cu-Zn family superoxide dismutase